VAQKRIFFLFRTYNDIDHIAPVAWKTAVLGWPTFFAFVDKDFSSDYRVRFLLEQGAVKLSIPLLESFRGPSKTSGNASFCGRLIKWILSYLLGTYLLRKHGIEVVVTEWTGYFGRGLSELFLRPARLFKLSVFSIPHGYFLWRNSNFNQIVDAVIASGTFPDFSNRNWFNSYVVQSEEHRAMNARYGMDPAKIKILGSARFCSEWVEINDKLMLRACPIMEDNQRFVVLFFLPHWDYQVERESCISLLQRIIDDPNLFLVIKAHTRGTGALSHEEQENLCEIGDVKFAREDQHSPALIRDADLVINFGSSIGFDALRRGTPVINPRYLHRNRTFFDDSGTVFDTFDETETLKMISAIKSREVEAKDPKEVEKFLRARVDNGGSGGHVLASYLELLASEH
jgi:hypothetical protein